MKRRDIIKGLTLLPLAGGVGVAISLESALAAPAAEKPDLFKELGVDRIINARGTYTYLGGSLMLPEVVEALNSTSQDFASLYEIEDKVGAKIAEMLHVEAAMVTAGAACALTLGTAAAITGKKQELIDVLPEVPGARREVIMQKTHRYRWDQAIRLTGVKIVEVEGPAEMEKAINANTVTAHFFDAAPIHSVTHEEFVAICKRNKIPSFIDCAANIPPVENLFKHQKTGFDLITFSGGKMLRAPQSSGLLMGRKDLIEAAKLNYDPYECPIGRPMKVSKEEMFGLYVALKAYLANDHEKEWKDWLARTRRIASVLETLPTVKAETFVNPEARNHFPSLRVSWDQTKVKITPQEVNEALKTGTPRIEANATSMLLIAVVTLKPEQVDIVAKRVKEILNQAVVKS